MQAPARFAAIFSRSGIARNRAGRASATPAAIPGAKGSGAPSGARRALALVALALLASLALGTSLAVATSPTATIDAPSAVSYTSVHLSGEVDPVDQETYYQFQYSTDPENLGWTETEYLGPLNPADGKQPVSTDLTGLAPGTKYFVRILASNFSDPEATSPEPNPFFTTDPVAAPTISIDPVTTFTGTSAHLAGKVKTNSPAGDPEAFDVNWHFECAPECPGLQGGTVKAENTDPDPEPDHAVSADAAGLQPNTSYEVKLVASNAGGQVETSSVSFETEPVAPEVRALYAGSVDTGSALLGAQVNPRNSPVTYYFEWGVGGAFDHQAPAAPAALAAEDNAFHVVTALITGLDPGTTYNFRLVATNTDTSESTTGVARGLTTLEPAGPPAPCPNQAIREAQGATALPDCRAYEMVSPLDKNGGNVDRDLIGRQATSRAADSGDAVAYVSRASFADAQSGTPIAQYRSLRTASGWTTRAVSPPLAPDAENGLTASFVHAFSADLSTAVVTTNALLTPGASALGETLGLYRENIGKTSSTYDLLSAPDSQLPVDEPLRRYRFDFVEASEDFSHVVFNTEDRQLTSQGLGRDVYEWVDGQLRLVSVLPGGAPAPEATGGAISPRQGDFYPGTNAISPDGSRIYFKVGGPTSPSGLLYVRENGTVTQVVSGSERTGDDPSIALNGAQFELASAPDGAIAYFLSGKQLTDDSNLGVSGQDLYRWDANAPEGDRLTDLTTADPDGGDVLGTVGASESGARVYFVAQGDLAPGAVAGQPNLYLWDLAQGVRHVSTLDGSPAPPPFSNGEPLDSPVWGTKRAGASPELYRGARVSPDGSALLFESYAQLTAYDNAGHRQVYLFDADTDALTCLSCNPLTTQSSANAGLFPIEGGPENTPNSPFDLPRNLFGDGSAAFFETSEALVRADTNAAPDVYGWADGKLDLVSSGQGIEGSKFIDAGESGDDLFFVTREQLVSGDTDQQADVYDARVGGGLPQQQQPRPCSGDECQGPPPATPAPPVPSTSHFQSSGNAPVKHRKKHHRKGHHKKKKHQKKADKSERSTTSRGASR